MLQRLLRHPGGVHSAHQHPRSAPAVDHISQLVAAGSIGGHKGKAEDISISQQPVVGNPAVQFLVHFHLVTGSLQDSAQNKRSRNRIWLTVNPARPAIGRKSL